MESPNALKQGYVKSHTIRYFFYNIKNFFRTFKWAAQRIKRGWSDYDIINLDKYYGHILPSTLRGFADKTESFPVAFELYDDNDLFKEDESFESWKNSLRDTADKIDYAFNTDPYDAEVNKSYKEFDEYVDEHKDWWGSIPQDMLDASREEAMQIHEKCKGELKEAFDFIAENFSDLWM